MIKLSGLTPDVDIIPMNDDEFIKQLDELDRAAKAESDEIKQIVAKVVKTYKPSMEAKL